MLSAPGKENYLLYSHNKCRISPRGFVHPVRHCTLPSFFFPLFFFFPLPSAQDMRTLSCFPGWWKSSKRWEAAAVFQSLLPSCPGGRPQGCRGAVPWSQCPCFSPMDWLWHSLTEQHMEKSSWGFWCPALGALLQKL